MWGGAWGGFQADELLVIWMHLEASEAAGKTEVLDSSPTMTVVLLKFGQKTSNKREMKAK